MKHGALTALLLWISTSPLHAGDFATRFDEFKSHATPAQLYTLLYDLPKGGDLHNHSGGEDRAETLYAVCTDPARNGGDTIYTRVRIAAQPDAISPAQRFRNIRQYTYDLLSAEAREEYVRL